MKQRIRPMPVLMALVLALALGACSNDDGGVTGVDDESIAPLSANYFPLAAGEYWDFIRIESGVLSPDTTIHYFDPDVPAAYTRWECDTGTGSDLLLRGSATSMPDGGGVVEHYIETWIDAVASGYDLVGENSGSAVDSSYVYDLTTAYPWIRFGQNRWAVELASYPADSLPVDYEGDQHGMRLLNEAIGFDFPRSIYDGSSQPGNVVYDPSDVDYDTYLDGIRSVRLVGEVIAEEDFDYAQFGDAGEILFPELADTVFRNCRWVRISLEADVFLSNQRDPNADPGEPAIPESYLANRSVERVARLDIGMLFLAPDVGPVVVITYTDLDKQVQMGDGELDQLVFQPDRSQIDILTGSSRLP